MGYPMTYKRMVGRNRLMGDYSGSRPDDPTEALRAGIAGDLRRLEQDQRDARHLPEYALAAGITEDQANKVLTMFFNGRTLDWPQEFVARPSVSGAQGEGET